MKETNQIIDRFLFSVMSAKLYESLIPMIVLIYVSHIYSSGGGIHVNCVSECDFALCCILCNVIQYLNAQHGFEPGKYMLNGNYMFYSGTYRAKKKMNSCLIIYLMYFPPLTICVEYMFKLYTYQCIRYEIQQKYKHNEKNISISTYLQMNNGKHIELHVLIHIYLY